LGQVTDGDKEFGDGSYVELGPGLQWVQIDLGHECAVYAVLFWHRFNWPYIYHDVIVRVSNDKDFRTGVRTLFNNDDDNSAGLGVGGDTTYCESYEGELLDAKGIRARYIRLYSNGSTSNQCNCYTEVEVWGVK